MTTGVTNKTIATKAATIGNSGSGSRNAESKIRNSYYVREGNERT